ncbi:MULTISPECIES: class II fructose-bisphosphate aldolase [Atopobiaceae]|uniref:Fructose-bisphosphate aldolase, class II/tagatose 1,6-diphosphate aldolase GatY/KbaY n=1 Tax=Parafannyhessea umbonata TaxID=604330 RepID=A0A1H6IC44_9ACTN|nr:MULTISPECIES: class II fructose-bisphosphate aldolase [Atopobiaceae]SEH44688.1 fructose-bisphosphate aldolase, class II/tagatose 1,6-diphosphate aldolase GatY/KbaY [Parafannyhessea umbonata]SJZ60717.1 fructose-bisphosphate aldolase, class II [Olsenella sp. KH1P3]
MLTTTKEMLLKAQDGHYAVGAFNVENLEFVMAVIAAAEERHSPVIMQTTPGTVKYASLDYFAAMARVAAQSASVPVAIHLDHGDGFDRCMQAMHAGYTSVMIDGSHEKFEDNIDLTASVTKVALPLDIPVEAELGKVGGKEDDGPAVEGESPYTDPDQAQQFVETTLCSSLAVGVGTAHGVYKGTPHIEQQVLKDIRSRVDVPLVLHGTSGVPDDQVAEAIKNGICKVNYATELRQAYTRGFMGFMSKYPDTFDPKKAAKPAMEEIKQLVMSHMDNLGSSYKA